MRILRDDLLNPIERDHPAYNESLIVHSRINSPNEGLIIFVHGLGGRRYRTWGSLPTFVFDDFSNLDVGLYDYVSGARRIRRSSSVSLPTHARELADTIRDSSYKTVVLVGHSMGGLLCKAVIKDLIDARSRTRLGALAIDKIAGLVLFATPQAGSLRVPRLLAPLTKDGRVLRAHSAFTTEIDERFKDRIETRANYRGVEKEKVFIPTYAVIATGDTWVDRLSASLGLPRDHTLTVRGTHTSIVKTDSREDGCYFWFAGCIRECITGPSVSLLTSPSMSPQPPKGLAHAGVERAVLAERLQAEIKRIMVEQLGDTSRAQPTINVRVELEVSPTPEHAGTIEPRSTDAVLNPGVVRDRTHAEGNRKPNPPPALSNSIRRLTFGLGVQGPDLWERLCNEPELCRHWGVDVTKGVESVRRVVTLNLMAHLERLTPRVANERQRRRYLFSVAVNFNIARAPEIRSLELTSRRQWLAQQSGPLQTSVSTSQRDLTHAIAQIADQITSVSHEHQHP